MRLILSPSACGPQEEYPIGGEEGVFECVSYEKDGVRKSYQDFGDYRRSDGLG